MDNYIIKVLMDGDKEPSEILKGAEINNSNRYSLHSLLIRK